MATCDTCEHCDKNETKDYGSKKYCTHYGTYVNPSEGKDCPSYK